MGDYGEVEVADFMRLMNSFVANEIDVDQYCRTLFSFFQRRMLVPNDEVSELLQRAFGDADDYDPAIKLPYTIDETELRQRVSQTLNRLGALHPSTN